MSSSSSSSSSSIAPPSSLGPIRQQSDFSPIPGFESQPAQQRSLFDALVAQVEVRFNVASPNNIVRETNVTYKALSMELIRSVELIHSVTSSGKTELPHHVRHELQLALDSLVHTKDLVVRTLLMA